MDATYRRNICRIIGEIKELKDSSDRELAFLRNALAESKRKEKETQRQMRDWKINRDIAKNAKAKKGKIEGNAMQKEEERGKGQSKAKGIEN